MTTQEQIKADMKAAMKLKDTQTLSILRVIIGEFSRIDKEVSDEKAIAILKKMHQNAIDQKNLNEEVVIEQYLPKMLSEEQIKIIVSGVIEARKFEGIQNMGQVMKIVKEHPNSDQIDMGIASKIAKTLL